MEGGDPSREISGNSGKSQGNQGIPGKCTGEFSGNRRPGNSSERFREFQGKHKEFQGIPGNFRESHEISGNVRESTGNSRESIGKV